MNQEAKCTGCKRVFIPEMKKNGENYKECPLCREKQKEKRERNKCKHGRQRAKCVECKGSQICIHGKREYRCVECKGVSICEHGRQQETCRECGGNQVCIHGRRKNICKDCGGASICLHGRQKHKCIDCGGSQICQHKKVRYTCIKCTPSRACKNCTFIYVAPSSKFHPYCFHCYCVLNPEKEIPRKFKLKEHYLRDALKAEIDTTNMIFDKACGPSRKRPDVLIPFENFNIIIECDENQHKINYDCECKRAMEIFTDLDNKPLVMLRFNPDSYTDHGKKVPGCFSMTKTAGWKVNKTEWKRRTDILLKILKDFSENSPEKDFTHLELFYDE